MALAFATLDRFSWHAARPVKQRPFMGARSCWAPDGVFWLQELLGSYYGGCRQCLWDLIGGLHVHA